MSLRTWRDLTSLQRQRAVVEPHGQHVAVVAGEAERGDPGGRGKGPQRVLRVLQRPKRHQPRLRGAKLKGPVPDRQNVGLDLADPGP